MKRKSLITCILLLLLNLLPFTELRAGIDPPVVGILDGEKGQLAVDSVVTIRDDKFFDPAFSSVLIKPYRVDNKVSLLIDESMGYYIPANFTATVGVQITYVNASSATIVINRTLTINYNTAINAVYSFINTTVFSGGHEVSVKITSITSGLPDNVLKSLKIMNELQAFPQFSFSQSGNAIDAVAHEGLASNTNADEIEVSWDPEQAADEYDLEWTYIDQSALMTGRYGSPSAPDPALLFRNSSARVTIRSTAYKVPLFYENEGVLFFRVRPVQISSTGGRLEADWSSVFTGGLGRFDFDGHEPTLNWQSSTSFAEEGKRKSVVQYFDGSLRNRQTVTKDNSSNTVVVAESIYDYQGRPVVQVMPAPTLNSVIGYTKNFNRGLNGNGYNVQDFDSLAEGQASCGFLAAPMLNTSGAPQYYSPNNPLKDSGFHKYIPQAYGFPFTQTEYLPDNTGRVSRVSGVGPTFKLGSGHETSYYYGTPDQKELDALFGTEAGYRSHYFKTMVRDANGQYSVSYTDMHGRTVATALAGNLPDSIKLDSLESRNAKLLTETLADSSNAQVNGLVMENNKGLLVAKPGLHTFSYQLSPESLQLEGCDSTLICYTCKYDLRIRITDDCGGEKLGGQAFDTLIRNFTIGSIDTTCAEAAAGFSVSFEKYLPEGSYQVTKQLIISQEAMDIYRDSVFLVKNSCQTLEEFIETQREILRLQEACKPSCDQCREDLGSWEVFWLDYRQRSGIADSDTASHKAAAERAYAFAVAECDELCGDAGEEKDIRKTMLLDMMPPSGQYANPSDTSNKFSIFYTEVLNETTGVLSVPNYRQVVQYTDEKGLRDMVYDEGAGNPVLPTALSAEAFSTMFKLSWADSLLRFHPEYCKLQKYLEYKTSHQWDEAVSKVETFREAVTKGYLNPTNHSSFTGFNGAGMFDPLATTHGFKSALEAKMNNYRSNPLNKHLWEIATMTGACKDVTPSCTTLVAGHAFDSTRFCTADLDIAWKTFRQAYFDIKRELINQQLNTTCSGTTPIDTLVAYNFAVRFGDATKLLALNNINLPTTESGANSMRDSASTKASEQFTSSCDSYVEHWVESLAPCTQYHPDSIQLVIIPLLKQVCMEGSDLAHPYGASSVKPGSTNNFRSFEEVIRYYNQTHGITDVYNCHPYRIKAPQPYDKQVAFSDKPVLNKPDSCECANISRYKVLYQVTGNKYASFSAFMQERFQTNISNEALNALLAACQYSGEGTGEDCNSMPVGTTLPPVFQCNTGAVCVDCETVKGRYEDFKNIYPNVRLYKNYEGEDSSIYRDGMLFEAFMNQHLAFSKSSGEYLEFLSSCGVSGLTAEADSLVMLKDAFLKSVGELSGVRYSAKTPEGETILSRNRLLTDGVFRFEDSIRNKTLAAYSDFSFFLPGGRKFCLDNGNSFEFKMKWDSIQNQNHTAYFLSGNFKVTVATRPNSFNLHGKTYAPGLYLIYVENAQNIEIGKQCYLLDSNYLKASEWNKYRAEIYPAGYRFYFNDELVFNYISDSALQIVPFASFGGAITARKFNFDWVKIKNHEDKEVYFNDFIDTSKYLLPLNTALCPRYNLDSAFAAYYNSSTGQTLTFQEIDSVYFVKTGSYLWLQRDTASVQSKHLSALLAEFYSRKVKPAAGFADFSMRTMAGTLTPDAGPKGVFDVNGDLIGNTVDGTVAEIKQSFVTIWNSSAVNQIIGELSLLSDGKFRLVLNPGQKAPCDGIVGMRYFQFDAPNTQFRIDVPFNSYIDFGDSTKGKVGKQFVVPRTTFQNYGDHGINLIADQHYVGDALPNCYVEAIHTYPDTTTKIVTVYHSDRRGYLHLWEGNNNLAYGDPRMLKNLRGYFPENMNGILWGSGVGTRMDSSFMNITRISNFNKIHSIHTATFFTYRLKNWWGNLGSLINNKDLRAIVYIANGQSYVNGDSTDLGLHKLIPNASVNFPKLGSLQYTGGTKANFDSVDFKGPNLRGIGLSYLNLDSAQIDRMLIELARHTTKDSGRINTWSIGGYRTIASDSAYNALIGRNWRINLKNSEPTPAQFPIVPIRDTVSAPIYNELTDYFNGLFGTNLTISELSDFYQQKTGKPLNGCLEVRDTAAASAADLSALLKEFQQEKLYPAAGYVDMDMRTFAGTLTPTEGPKGVFDVNGNLIGNTADTTDMEVKASYVQLWNSSSVNQAVGTLSLLSNGRFRLSLKPGQKAPCQGILGMRYYEMEFTDSVFKIRVGKGSFIDFGDGISGAIVAGNVLPATSITFSNTISLTNNMIEEFYANGGSPNTYFDIAHSYTSSGLYKPKIYHSEVDGYIHFIGGGYPVGDSRHFKYLKGYFPQYLRNLYSHYQEDSLFFDSRRIRNYSQINTLQYFVIFSRKFETTNNFISSLANNKGLRHINYTLGGNVTYSTNSPYEIPPNQLFPNASENFKELSSIKLTGVKSANFDSVTFALPKLRYLVLSYLTLSSSQVDRMLIEIARNTQMDSGVIRSWSIGGLRTAASDSAYNSLLAKNWQIQLTNSTYSSYVPNPYIPLIDTVVSPVSSEFTDYFNARYGTNLLRQQVDSFYKQKTGQIPDVCTLDSTVSSPDVPTLCGRAAPLFVMSEQEVIDNCTDSTFFAVSVGTELFRAYTDSVRGYFDSAYIAKCLGALKLESFTVTHEVSEYHHTLYYYDQAGNLLKTVPPAGVRANYSSGFLDSVVVARRTGTLKVPAHELVTQYRYNSLNQVTAQHTPDAGLSSFWYDRLGRLSVSQNAKQKAASGTETGRLYSYTQYDELGRITEVGEIGNEGATAMSAALSKNATDLSTWLSASAANKGQITTTVYDLAYPGFTGINPTPITQWNLRNRVSYTSITHGNNTAQYNQATFYSYDVHGNVDTLVQDYGVITTGTMNVMNANGHRFKKMVYKYDLISGKVNMMQYQPRLVDQLIHRYSYDAENRLTLAETSLDSLIWEKEARYYYFKHGPLARVELGQNKVQGLDYAYTLQGWLKGVNSSGLRTDLDMGRDADTTLSNRWVGRDEFSFSLNYFTGDFEGVKETELPFPSIAPHIPAADYRPLYNGNISSMTENIRGITASYAGPGTILYNYRYDQLNRIKGMNLYQGYNLSTNTWAGMTTNNQFRENYRYDPNGNILQLQRAGFSGNVFDSLNYHYYTGTNKLRKVSDNISATLTNGDLDHQGDEQNYIYDEIGNLTGDASENITSIKWNVYGKITEINRTATSGNTVKKISYTYDASGNRISKMIEYEGTANRNYTWYVRDAQGNTLTTYTSSGTATDPTQLILNLSERYTYGSSRIGAYNYQIGVDGGAGGIGHLTSFVGRRGTRKYELSNHLGNVLSVVTDRKIPVPSGDGSLILSYTAHPIFGQGYYPFGMGMPTRGFSVSASSSRYGFNGKENDNEVKGTGNQQDYGMRIYDPRVGRFLSVDPLTNKFPFYTPYQFSGNTPIWATDLDGAEPHIALPRWTVPEAVLTLPRLNVPVQPVPPIPPAIPTGFSTPQTPTLPPGPYMPLPPPTPSLTRTNPIDETGIDPNDATTYPAPPFEGKWEVTPIRPGTKGYEKLRDKGATRLENEKGDVLRWHKSDQWHPKGHWDLKRGGSVNNGWENYTPNGTRIPEGKVWGKDWELPVINPLSNDETMKRLREYGERKEYEKNLKKYKEDMKKYEEKMKEYKRKKEEYRKNNPQEFV